MSYQVDLIVALGGGDRRKAKAKDLFDHALGRFILFTGELNVAQAYLKFSIQPLTQGLITQYVSKNTCGDAAQINDCMKTMGFSSIIIVTSNYHLPRVKAIFGRALAKYSLQYIGTSDPCSFSQWLGEKYRLAKFLLCGCS